MKNKSLTNFNLKNFSRILLEKMGSFSELDDSLVSSDLEKYLSTKEDVQKFEKLLIHFKGNESSADEKYEAKFSNGESLFIK